MADDTHVLTMLRIGRLETEPFHSLRYQTSGRPGKVQKRDLPFYKAFASGLPTGIDALVLASDLQGREVSSANRLLGVAVADSLAVLIARGLLPAPQAVLLCGDLYDYPDCHKRGGTGPVDEVYQAFSKVAPHVIGVMGNHDELEAPDSLPPNVQVLDGQVVIVSGLSVGGVSGIVGDSHRHQRRAVRSFVNLMEDVIAQQPSLLLLHQGPEDPVRQRLGDPDVSHCLAQNFAGLTVFGHTYWNEPWLIDHGGGQVLNCDGRVVVLLTDS